MRCCITGEPVTMAPQGESSNFVGFQATHIFPPDSSDEFFIRGYDGHIEDPALPLDESTLDSVQNGFLCDAKWHLRFVNHQIGINPDMSSQCLVRLQTLMMLPTAASSTSTLTLLFKRDRHESS
ncbi:hypothetical protein CERSUDRAFT_113083 [Gelatoporia subvermispora B]|uniref:HNH nuclease domain-containing protein n=1 Tax=Ceriporiopsis subvermispora (strain B) TaxID=914234 RepID=M2RGN3_CERS8|nr:hypothetical protein CERSUDRAFT_113083 [Gelatoporia subvermispora B]